MPHLSALHFGLTAAGLPPDLPLHAVGARAVIDALADRRWHLDARYADDRWAVRVQPLVIHGVAQHGDQFYDTRVAAVRDNKIVVTDGGWSRAVPIAMARGGVYRGLRYEAYREVLRTGQIGGVERFWSDVAAAVGDAVGVWPQGPTFERPAIILRVSASTRPTAAGVSASAVTDVYVGCPYRVKAGVVELCQTAEGWTERSRQSPTTWLVWRRVDPGTVLDSDHVYRLGFCVTCATVARNCVNLGGAGSGNFGHAGRPGEVGGSTEGDGSTSTQAVTTKGSGDTITPAEVKSPDLGRERPTPIKVATVAEGVERILKGEVVELKDVGQVHTVLTKLADMAREAKAKGEKAQDFDLCKVSVAGSNLFCGSPLKTSQFPHGVPRIEMPQMKGKAVPGSDADRLPKTATGSVDAAPHFIQHLREQGIKVTPGLQVPASSLRATQAQMEGRTVADMMTDPTYDPSIEPIFISNDGYVLDGHHRWAAVVGRDAEDGKLGDSKMNVIRVDAPISELYHRASQFADQIGIARKAKKLRGYAAKVYALLDDPRFLDLGGEGSGNFGHAGRPGEVGGSGSGAAVAERPSDGGGNLIVSPSAPSKDTPLTVVFGGSFNPPHAGHVKAVTDAVTMLEDAGYTVGKVIVAPTADKLLSKKLGDKMYPLAERTELAKRTFTDPRVEVSSGPGQEAEAETGKLRRTQLADWAAKRNEGTNVVNVTGEDAAPGSPPGFPSIYEGDKGTSHEGYHYLAVTRDEGGQSSTKIRTAIREGTPVPDMTPEAEAYLREMLAKNPHIQLSFDLFEESWVHLGGPGSGNFGHAGRPGEVGGSSSSGEGAGGGTSDETGLAYPHAGFPEPSAELVQHHADKIRNDPKASAIEKEHAEIFGRAEAINDEAMKNGDSQSQFGVVVGKDAHGQDIVDYDQKEYRDPDTGEMRLRSDLHDEVLEEVTAKAPKGLERPTAIILGGMTAAGKSTFVDELKRHVNEADYVNINADEMKEKLPEYNGENAAVVHEESSHMAKAATALAMANRQNLILDATMGTEGKAGDHGMIGQIEKLKAQGYNVQVMFMDVDVATSTYRSMNRYLDAQQKGESARYVPGRIIRKNEDKDYGSKPRRTYEAVKRSGLLSGENDGYIMIDNRGHEGPTSYPPRTAEGRGGGKVVERKGNLVIPRTHFKPAEHGA